jgi:uncharacterized protein (TIGR02147 family)
MNYRDFLLDFYNEQKARRATFSYQFFANKAGFKSKSFIKLVIDGKKNLTKDSIEKVNRVLKLDEKPFSYFEDLVAFNQAKSLKMRNYFFERLISYNKRNPARLILQQQYEFYSRWYHNTIRELVTMVDFRENYELLARMVKPPISARHARESVKLLLKLNLIKKTETGYVQNDHLITTGDEVQSLAVQNFHLQNLVLAGEAMDTCSAPRRDVSCLVLGLSRRGFGKMKSEIQNFRKRLLQIAEDDSDVSRVFHVNFQLFPTSGDIKGDE